MNPLVKGKVAGGNRLGRTLGFPTANIPLKEDDPVRNGVYAARVRIDGTEHEAVVNVGHRPTVGNGPDRVLEAHLLDFEGDLYGQTIEVELLEFLREEQRFGSTEELSRQMKPTRSGRANASAGTRTSEGGRATKHSLNFRICSSTKTCPTR